MIPDSAEPPRHPALQDAHPGSQDARAPRAAYTAGDERPPRGAPSAGPGAAADPERARRDFRLRLAEAFSRRPWLVMLVVGVLLLIGIAQETAEQWLGDGGTDLLLVAGGLIPTRVWAGDWWRLLAATALHQNWSHLLVNVVGLVLVGRPIESAFGATRFWWIYFGSALAGALASLSNPAVLSVGASGAVFGLMGAMVAIGLRLWPRLTPGLQRSLVLMPLGIAIVIGSLGLLLDEVARATLVDHRAHLGGACGGLVAGLLLELRLRDRHGALLAPDARPSAGRRARLLWLGACIAGLIYVGSLGRAALQLRAPPLLETVAAQTLTWHGEPLAVPTGLRTGVWRAGRCSGELVDVAWALESERTVCFELPLGGVLLLGRPTQLLTMDELDRKAMRRAGESGHFVRRHRGALLMPMAGDLLYVLLGSDALLDSYGTALAAIAPPAVPQAPFQPRPGPGYPAAPDRTGPEQPSVP